ncbi:MAG: choice-of-anchor D domain-containing protein [Archangium sp.]|nr:choice-of-anchor D domain-containing protein [Archangium sp.]MDP3572133.1 choice-of-anchor D domain-containing protein [Archangium sp.]
MFPTFRSALLVTGLVFLAAGCHLGPSVTCTDDAPCAPWGHCSAAGYCLLIDSELTSRDAGTEDAGRFDAGAADAGDDAVDAGLDAGVTAIANVSTAPLEFGATECGGEKVLQLAIANSGVLPLTFSATASNPLFGLSGTSNTLAPGAVAQVTITARVPSASASGQQHDGLLSIDTNDPARPRVFVPLHATASGVTLVATPSLLSFGVVPLNVDAPPVTVTITNTGTQSATVQVAQPLETQFRVAGPSSFTIAPGATFSGLAAQFRPTRISPSSGSAPITVTERVCGVSHTALPMTGQGTSGVVGLSSVELFFGTNGRVTCGTQAPARSVVLTNGGNAAYAWSASLTRGAGSPFTVTPSSGTVPALGMVVLNLTSSAIPQVAATTPEGFSDVLTLITDAANDPSHRINLHQTAAGGALRFNSGAIDFGNVPLGSSAQAPFTLVNDGNEAVAVTLASTAPVFTLDSTAAATVVPGTLQRTARFEPTNSLNTTGTISMSLVPNSGVLCAPLPTPVALSGTGTSGSVTYSPLGLDFGEVDCGATASPRVITFSNPGNRPYQVIPSLARGTSSPFTFTMTPGSGDVAADGGTLVVTVTPRAVPVSSSVSFDFYADSLDVTTDVVGDVPHHIALHQTARGSIFSLSSTALDFGAVPVGVSAAAQFTVTNTGNAAGTLRFLASQPNIFSLPAEVTLNGGGGAAVTASFTPLAASSYSDSAVLSVAASTVLCQPLSSVPVSLVGAGTGAQVVTQSETSLTFGSGGFVPCGAQAAARSFTLRNDSSQVLTLGYAFSGTAYQVNGPASVAVGASVTVVVTPLPVPATADTSPDFFAETLTVTAAGGPVNEVHAVMLHLTAQGAKLAFNPGSLALRANHPGSQTLGFFVENTGNLAATYALTLAGSNRFALSSSATSVAANNRSSGSITFTPNNSSAPQSGSIGITSSSPLCAPLPMGMMLTGN